MGFFHLPAKTFKKKKKKHVHFASGPFLQKRHPYPFDWTAESSYWYNRSELALLQEQRFEEADLLRKERGISTSSRDDADKINDGREKDIYVGDTMTRALDDVDDGPVSVRGIEHFVWPVLQKEMISRKKELKAFVVRSSADRKRRMDDPTGEKLALAVMERSLWARNVATERGIKYCQMKRGGALLKNTHAILGRRKLEVGRLTMTKRDSLIRGMKRMSVRGLSVKGGGFGGGGGDAAVDTDIDMDDA